MIDINLLPPQNVLSQKEKAIRSLLLKIVSVVTALFILITGILFGLKLYFSSQLATQTAKRDQLLVEFKSQSQIANQIRSLKDKVSAIKIIQETRINFASIAAELKNVTEGTNVKNFSVDFDGSVKFSGSTDNLQNLDTFIQRISSGTNNPFTATVLANLRQEAGGGFSYSVNTKYLFSKPK